MVTEPNEPIHPIIVENYNFEQDRSYLDDRFQGLTIRQHTIIQLAAGMWSNPAILQHCRGDVKLMATLIPIEAVKGADRLINALNEPLETVKQPEQPDEENDDDKPSDYTEEK